MAVGHKGSIGIHRVTGQGGAKGEGQRSKVEDLRARGFTPGGFNPSGFTVSGPQACLPTRRVVQPSQMATDLLTKVREIVPAKAFAIAAYGESVAAYRYRTLVDKTNDQRLQSIFQEMCDEEQDHHRQVQELNKRHFPGSDFVLTADDKAMVIDGPRLLEVNDQASFDEALSLIYESELLTGRFYHALEKVTDLEELKPLFKEMGDECFQHAKQLNQL